MEEVEHKSDLEGSIEIRQEQEGNRGPVMKPECQGRVRIEKELEELDDEVSYVVETLESQVEEPKHYTLSNREPCRLLSKRVT